MLSVSKKNTKVTEIIDNLKVILERKPELGVKSVSDLLCNWIIEKYDKLVEDVAAHPQPKQHTTTDTIANDNNSKEIKQDSFLKRLLCKKSIPALDKYNVYRINGKSVSEAYKAGYLTKDEISNIYSGAAQIYYDMTRDSKLSNVLHLMNSKNNTKSKNRLEWFNRKMKNAFSLDSTEKIELPKDLHELELVE